MPYNSHSNLASLVLNPFGLPAAETITMSNSPTRLSAAQSLVPLLAVTAQRNARHTRILAGLWTGG